MLRPTVIMAVDKFFSLGVLTFCGVCYVLYPSHRNAKNLGVLQHPEAATCLRPWSSKGHAIHCIYTFGGESLYPQGSHSTSDWGVIQPGETLIPLTPYWVPTGYVCFVLNDRSKPKVRMIKSLSPSYTEKKSLIC